MIDTAAALKYFKTKDPVMYALLQKALSGPCLMDIPTSLPETEYFPTIVKSIISQQISVAAARTISERVKAALGDMRVETLASADIAILRKCGLSEKKVSYIKQNARRWTEIPIGNFGRLSDEEIISILTELHGVGRWTAEMFLIFSLARPDVFSFGDLGLRASLCQNYNYKPRYVRKIRTKVAAWSPHRTVASLVLWHQRDNGPERPASF